MKLEVIISYLKNVVSDKRYKLNSEKSEPEIVILSKLKLAKT